MTCFKYLNQLFFFFFTKSSSNVCVCSGPCLFTFYSCGNLSILELFNFPSSIPVSQLCTFTSLGPTISVSLLAFKGSLFLQLWSPHRTWKTFSTSSTGRAWSSSETALDLAEKDSLVSSRFQELRVCHGFLHDTVCLCLFPDALCVLS